MSGVSRKTSISITGLDEFRETLEELGGDFKKAIKAGARKAGNEIAKEANAEAKSRGWSEDKYYDVKERKSSKGSDTSVAIKVGTDSRQETKADNNVTEIKQGNKTIRKEKHGLWEIETITVNN